VNSGSQICSTFGRLYVQQLPNDAQGVLPAFFRRYVKFGLVGEKQ
jgi:hypothetical protein